MALCQITNCLNEAEHYTLEADYNTICKNHLQTIRCPADKILKISDINKDNCLNMIKLKQDQIQIKLQGFTNEIKRTISYFFEDEEQQKASIIEEIDDLVSISQITDETECRKIMVRLNYWNSELLKNNSFKVKRKAAHKKIKLEKSGNKNLNVKNILSNSSNNKVSIQKWSVSKGSEDYIMKIYIIHKSKYQPFVQKEIDFLSSRRDDSLFSKPKQVTVTETGFETLSEFNDFSFELGLLRVRYSENEVFFFFKFVEQVLRELSGNIELYYLDPTMISYEKKKFKLTDFKYIFSPPVKKYLSIEYTKDNPNLIQALIFSAGLIALEMLGCSIDGLNSLPCQSILIKSVDSLKLSQSLTELLKSILTYNPDSQINIHFLSSKLKS